ncbi:precorrin-6y C5,15-methyltransferase (decarboxylating) subunit CbiE [Flammeovirga sp. EKP202]|uniref:precorrin-6y C5,15-methyltransferase (decarboxylating) subunit CbiE n=1 Tax=Flammeovirga sp. EKP202 TaxID=2770592 RepID=UPI00165FE471|nr:precorrin-6y C5,15-methyltransferase (decarboxylating) subunit CbiE [Flammeovirga sp. EKP202]MBD0402595.1 precorrin-6y C5,15-methyltransferase (decarboxylating) subunit CbiE [Flammeovirga sp. EKP202]
MLQENKHIDFYIIGIGNHSEVQLNAEVKQLIQHHTVFSGGKRHYQLVKKHLPENHEWIEISGKMQDVIQQYQTKEQKVVIFASGDPLFFGFGNTLKRLLPNASIEVLPYFNSIQRLAHKTSLNYSDLKSISLHGRRTWKPLDICLMQGEKMMGILTDKGHSPQHIAQRLLTYGYPNYTIYVGEELDGEKERVRQFTLEEANETADYQLLNCVILIKTSDFIPPRSIADSTFQTLEGRPGMMTKQPIRSLTLQALELWDKKCFWDVGSCTGSIAIEAQLNYPSLQVFAFEKRTECGEIIDNNAKRHHCPGIVVSIDDFFEEDIQKITPPDVVFIGGHGNRLEEMIQKLDSVLLPNGLMVMNTVLEKSYETFQKVCLALNYTVAVPIKMSLNDHNTIHLLVAKKNLK